MFGALAGVLFYVSSIMFTTIRLRFVLKTSSAVSAARANASSVPLKLRMKFSILGCSGIGMFVCPVLCSLCCYWTLVEVPWFNVISDSMTDVNSSNTIVVRRTILQTALVWWGPRVFGRLIDRHRLALFIPLSARASLVEALMV